MKLTPGQQRELIPDESVHQSFLKRPDIAALLSEEQERQWQDHLVKLNEFRRVLSQFDCIGVIDASD
jgi:hypothetical protein